MHKNKRCASCVYRASPVEPHNCDYVTVTGHTRTAQVRSGRQLAPSQCPFYEQGERARIRPEVCITPPSENVYIEPVVKDRRYKIDHVKAMELYRQGKNDREIGDELGVLKSTVLDWRKRNNLPSRYSELKREAARKRQEKKKNQLAARSETFDTERAWELIAQGMSDRKAAALLHTNEWCIQRWRKKNGIPSGHTVTDRTIRVMYERGKSDREVSEVTGLKVKSLRNWRWRHGVAMPSEKPETHRKKTARVNPMEELYRQGMTDREISETLKVTKSAVQQWRKKRGLLPNKKKKST